MKETLLIGGQEVVLDDVKRQAQSVHFTLDGKAYHFRVRVQKSGGWLLECEVAEGVWQQLPVSVRAAAQGAKLVQVGSQEVKVTTPMQAGGEAAADSLSPHAPMPGVVRQILVSKGDAVEKGQALIVMEAMKLQTTLNAGGDGVVEAIPVAVGDMVTEGAELVRLKAKEAA